MDSGSTIQGPTELHIRAHLQIRSFSVGFVPFIGESFAISRIFYFAPYFFLGIMLQNVKVIDEIKLRLKA